MAGKNNLHILLWSASHCYSVRLGVHRSKDLTVLDYSDFKPSVTFQLKPSAGSAFLPLATATPSKTPSQSPTAVTDLSET
ncbi:hypothetical protein LSTR_LSTR017016 [Laodelphax striatellus]|uniref:Uncharacterized protein n=1 Tax=Laodelphax striatellus TaxID=195883 RepID=A0A482XLE6_LAOST|nr:hypothetical protein LSTR_LSTR017016 [Laodelphax striatellus]